ncbi:hypothetical protein QVL82_13625, partial [Cellulosimicrobium funkei]
VVHTGFPGAVGAWFGADRTVVVACGTGRANARAAVALLQGVVGPRTSPDPETRRADLTVGAAGEGER